MIIINIILLLIITTTTLILRARHQNPMLAVTHASVCMAQSLRDMYKKIHLARKIFKILKTSTCQTWVWASRFDNIAFMKAGSQNRAVAIIHRAIFIWQMAMRLIHEHKFYDTLSEWLRRWTRNPLGSARRGSNPLGVAIFVSFPKSNGCTHNCKHRVPTIVVCFLQIGIGSNYCPWILLESAVPLIHVLILCEMACALGYEWRWWYWW